MSGGQGGRGSGGGFQQPGGVMGQPGFRPTPRVGDPSMSGLPPQLAGTGGVRSPAGPYGPPGFIGGGSVPVSGAQPYNPGVGTTMQPNGTNNGGGYPPGWAPGESQIIGSPQTGGLEPAPYGGMGSPAPTNGPRLPPIPPGTPPMVAENWGFLHSRPNVPQAGTPEWFQSAQGLNAQKEMAMRLGNNVLPGSMNGSHFTGAHQAGRPDPRTNGGEGYVSPYGSRAAQSAQSQSNWQNPDWRMQQVLAGKIAPTNNAELQAMLANMSPADREAYLAKYRSIGLDPAFSGGGGSFGQIAG